MKKTHISLFDLQEWIYKLRQNNITQFEHSKLPKELQRRTFIQKARGRGLLRSVRITNGRNVWMITDILDTDDSSYKQRI